jgi:diguanylate cyclase (GGDEF)-like protein
MRSSLQKHRMQLGLGLLLATGFALAAAVGYFTAVEAIRHNLVRRTLPLTADNVHAEIRASLSRPMLASSLMAQDATLRDWILGGESDTEQITRYLKEAGQKYGAGAAFLASNRTRQSYHADTPLTLLQEADPRDKWFFQLRDLKTPFPVHTENAGNTIVVHHRILDQNGDFIGAAGMALKPDNVIALLSRYRDTLQVSAYLVNAEGLPVLAGKDARPLRERAGIRTIANAILGQTAAQAQLEYQLDGGTVLVHTRLIPELGWRLIVEQDVNTELAALLPALWQLLAIAAITTLLALLLVRMANRRTQMRVEQIASIDPLTGVMNRQAFDIMLRQSMMDFERNGRPLSVILFDIDSFKLINQRHGYEAGDEVLREVAQVTKEVVRENDIITRWGSEEFLIFLRECDLEVAARLADKLRAAIAAHDFGLGEEVTASVGVAQYVLEEPAVLLFARADQARYEAKASGRNRTIVSIMDGQDAHEPLAHKRA